MNYYTDSPMFCSMGAIATEEVNGWPKNVKAPSAIPYNPDHCMPKEMSLDDIEQLKKAWVAAVRRALKAGFDGMVSFTPHSSPCD